MRNAKLGITDDGYVYQLNERGKKVLGHLARLVNEPTAVGREVRVWWEEQFMADGPCNAQEESQGADRRVAHMIVKDATLAVGGDPEDLTNELVA